jgi:predicted nucleic acid-binding protein
VIGITLDSNIYISALIFGGKPLLILEMGLDGRADIAISEEILRETLGIMRHKFKLPEERVAQARQYIEAAARRVKTSDQTELNPSRSPARTEGTFRTGSNFVRHSLGVRCSYRYL